MTKCGGGSVFALPKRPGGRPLRTAGIRGTLFKHDNFTTQIPQFWSGSTDARRRTMEK